MFLIILSLSFFLLFFQVRETLKQKIKDELNQSNQTITNMVETTATVSIKTHLKTIAEKNREIISHFYQQFRDGEITESNAQKRSVQVLLSQTVGDTGYIYCVNSKGVAVVHPQAGVLGKNFSHRKFVQNQISKKEGYIEYEWKNPNEIQKKSKALYMTYFEPWDWVISVSSYKSEFIKLIDINDLRIESLI
jgi:signal transduction histidine kinase